MELISKELMEYSIRGIIHRKTRSILTIFSITIGIIAIFILVSYGMGLYSYVEQFSSASSADKITVMPKSFGGVGMDEDFQLTEQDLRAVRNAPGVYDATGIYYKAAEITRDKEKKYAFMIAYDPEKPIIMEISNIDILSGRELKKGDSGKVVLGYNYLIKDKIFSKSYELNDKITVDGNDFRVIGFYDSVGSPQDDAQIYLINSEYEKIYPDKSKGYNWIVGTVDISKIKDVITGVENALRKTRNLEKGKEDFFVQSFEDLIKTFSNVLNGIIAFVMLIALISMVVSAINTSNTMITSVLERTREIGVMKSVGAKNIEIAKIFIFESGFLGAVAGVIGVAIGFFISSALGSVIKTAGWGFLTPAFPWTLFAGCIIFAALTGAISGLAPAIRASRISPVQALRYE